MTIRSLFLTLSTTLTLLVSSCGVDQQASFFVGAAKTGEASKKEKISAPEKSKKESAAEKSKTEAAAEKSKKEAAAEARSAAAKVKAEEALKLAEAKAEAKEKAEKAALTRKKAVEKATAEAAVKKAREEALSAKVKAREVEKQAKLVAKQQAETEEAARELASLATERRGGGFFSMLFIGSSEKQYKSEGHEIFVNHSLLPALDPSNAKIEIDLGDQRARIYRKSGPSKVLVIETQISSGKSGHSTPTGTWTIGEKLEQKQSSLYGTWLGASGSPVGGSNESGRRPSGASHFVGADMPYWMRITGGIGMHVGVVPGFPASHGCIRVPASVQPLIFAKVGLGTPVTITH